MRKILITILLLISFKSISQELNCRVYINSDEIGISNKQIFTTLQSAIEEYMNNTKWTNLVYRDQEKFNCSLTINILENSSVNNFKGSLQLLVSRPVYNSSYNTPILSFNDNDVSFSYEEYEPLLYNENLLSPVYEPFRMAMYNYHIHGLDIMAADLRTAKEIISQSIIELEKIFDDRPNTFLIRVFMDTKGDEIVDIFSDGPRIETTQLRQVLTKIFPSFDPKWREIKI